MSHRDDRVSLDDILESIQKIETYTQEVSAADFAIDPQLQDAVIRRLEIIGEAVKNISSDLKDQYPIIPWRPMAGMRDVLIHGYFGVNIQRVWSVVKNDLPDLKQKILTLRQRL